MTIKLDALINSLEGIETIIDSAQVAKLSQDYHTFSPVLSTKCRGNTLQEALIALGVSPNHIGRG